MIDIEMLVGSAMVISYFSYSTQKRGNQKKIIKKYLLQLLVNLTFQRISFGT